MVRADSNGPKPHLKSQCKKNTAKNNNSILDFFYQLSTGPLLSENKKQRFQCTIKRPIPWAPDHVAESPHIVEACCSNLPHVR